MAFFNSAVTVLQTLVVALGAGLGIWCNISIEHLGNMERGQGKPSLELLVEIALYFQVSTDYLLLGRELDRDSVRASLLELSAQMTELAGKL